MFSIDTKIPLFLRYVIYFFKKAFCILTIKSNKICILPYKKVTNKLAINIITKILVKSTKSVVLSNYLNNIKDLNNMLYNNGIHIYKGNILQYYLIYNMIDYISKVKKEDTISQEVFILINNLNDITKNSIIYLSQKFKRINIVTYKINNFTKISDYLESLGIPITVTNNKRKSLSKAKIIVNFDFNEDMLNTFNINRAAIIIEMNKEVIPKSKLFNGINVLDFQMIYDSSIDDAGSIEYKKFSKKILYEESLRGKKYDDIIRKIEEDNLRIVNLIGRNGVINSKEYVTS